MNDSLFEDSSSNAISQRLSQALRNSALSGPALADRIGVHRNTLHSWLVGEVAPRADKLLEACNHLEVDASWVLTGQPSFASLSPQLRLFTETLQSIPEAAQPFLISVLTTIIQGAENQKGSAAKPEPNIFPFPEP